MFRREVGFKAFGEFPPIGGDSPGEVRYFLIVCRSAPPDSLYNVFYGTDGLSKAMRMVK